MTHKLSRPLPTRTAASKLRHPLPTRRLLCWLLTALTGAGLITRLLWMGRRSLHGDETLQLNGIQTTTWQALIEHCTHVDMHPPLAYLVQKMVYAVSQDVFWLRMPSALLGTAVIPVTYWALRPLTGRFIALAAAAATMASYHLIWFSREMRDYIFFYFFVVAAFGCLVRVLRAPRLQAAWPCLAGFTLANVLAVYSHFNTYLIWPVFGLFVVADEAATFGWRGIRRTRILWLIAAGAIILLLAAPTFGWFMNMYHVQQGATLRPGPMAMLQSLSRFGLGEGWRTWFWAIWVATGFLALYRRPRARLWSTIWMLMPIVCFIYIVGMPDKFIANITRYQITLALGFATLQGAAVAWGIRLCLPRKSVRSAYILATIMPALLVAALMASDFGCFYRLRATSMLFNDAAKAFSELGKANLLLDNYYEIQYLHHYLPPNLRVAAPPVFNNPDEYAVLHVSEYARRTIESFPFLAYYDSTGSRGQAAPNTDWSWLEKHFMHRHVFLNTDGAALERRGLNFFAWPSNLGRYQSMLYWNDRNDLPAWFAQRGQIIGATIGPEWFVIPCRMGETVQTPLPVLAAPGGSLLICNTGATSMNVEVSMQLAAGAPDQIVRCRAPNGVSEHFGPFGAPSMLRDLRNGETRQGFLPFGTLCLQTGGLLQLPFECVFQPQTFRLNLPRCVPGLTVIDLALSQPTGIVLLGLSVTQSHATE